MAYTKILKIKSTPQEAIKYITEAKEMEIIETVSDDNEVGEIVSKNDENGERNLSYIMRDKHGNTYKLSTDYLKEMERYIHMENGEIVFETITNGYNCNPRKAHEEFEMVRSAFKNRGDVIQYQIIQNFGTVVDPELANKIGMEFAERYLSDYQCVVSTHINTGYVHNHIDFNAVSFVTGKKFNDRLEVINSIRKISDDLCKKYELSVIEQTGRANFIKYETPDGTIKFFEPTERKMKSIDEYSNNDYRNSDSYKAYEKPKTHRTELIEDIEKTFAEKFLTTYEDLLSELQMVGYKINDKTKDGDWKEHISFQKEGWNKAVRDIKLGENYLRLALTQRIEKLSRSREEINMTANGDYHYGKIDIDKLHDDYKYESINGVPIKTIRTQLEIYIIHDVKNQNHILELEIKNAKNIQPDTLDIQTSDKRVYHIKCIEDSLKTLRFVEKKNIGGFPDITENMNSLYQKQNQTIILLNRIRDKLSHINENVTLIKRYNALSFKSIENTLSEKDKILFDMMEKSLQKKNLFDVTQQERYVKSYEESRDKFHEFIEELKAVSKEISEYDSCVRSIKRMDKNYGFYADDIKAYELYHKELEGNALKYRGREKRETEKEQEMELE